MSHNISVAQKYSSSIGKRYLPLREFMGKDVHGAMVGREAWHDMHTNRTFDAGPNWENPPPDLPSGDAGREAFHHPPGQRFRENFGKIDWNV